ncbi:MAG: pitrilysin family protein [Mariprofundaceae bacterium]|nr:pitrilysin family protein [Mariprofundaceae bacterium]
MHVFFIFLWMLLPLTAEAANLTGEAENLTGETKSLTPQTTKLHYANFNNGVRLVVEEDHASPVAMVQIWLKVGGRDELPGKTGLAHVFEHMMFKGSKAMLAGEYSKAIAAMGGNDNAFTSTDYTAYFETVPAAQVSKVIDMEAERFAHLRLDADEFNREIRVIMEERRMRTEDNPNSHMFEELSAAALRLHPYRNPVIGWMQDLKRLTIDDVRDFYQLHYVAGNVTVVVVGDVDFLAVKERVANTFGTMEKRTVAPRFNPQEPTPLGAKRVNVHLPAKLPILAMVIPVPVWKPGSNDRTVAALAVATYALAGGRSALMQQQLIDQQRIAFSVDAGYDPFGMGLDLWYAYGALRSGADVPAFEQAMWALIQTLADKPLDEARLHAAKRNMVASDVFARDSLYLRAKRIGRLETVGIGADHFDAWLEAVRQVTAKDVQKVVADYLQPQYSTTGILHAEAMK